MTDGGHVLSEGLPEHLLGGADPLGRPEGVPTPGAEPHPAYTFLDQPDGLDEDEDVLLMPGPQVSWGDAAVHGAVETVVVNEPAAASPLGDTMTLRTIEEPPAAPVGQPVEPSWPPLTPPAVGVPATVAEPVAQPAPETLGQPLGQPVAQPAAQAQVTAPQPPRRPLHAGPPIPDPSLMTGHVPVRSLADRGPSGSTPAYGVPIVPAPVMVPPMPVPAPVAAPVQPEPVVAVEPVVAEPIAVEVPVVEPVAVEPVAVEVPVEQPVEPVVIEPVIAEPVAVEIPAEPVVVEAPVAEPIAVEPLAVEVPAELPVVEPIAVEVPAEPAVVEAIAVEPVVTEPIAVELIAAEPIAVEPVAVEVPAEPVAIPAQAAAPVRQPGRISAFLAAPAPHGLPTVEAEPRPEAVPSAETVSGELTPASFPVQLQEQPEPELPELTAVQPEPVAETPAPQPDPQPQPDLQPEPVAPEAQPEPEPVVAQVEAEPEAESEPEIDTERPPAAPGYDEAGRDAVHQVIRERRDIRNGFRSDPIPHEVLIRVLEAAHTAPSVGYSQPWDFVVIRSAKTRRRMHELAERQREAYADSLPKARAKQFKEIKIEAILDTPVNIVVTADRTRGGRHTLGRHTQPQMAPYSAALAVENLWLAARAEGLGVGWVSFFDEEEMVRELGLPDHLDVVAYLCVGYVDSFPEEPELQQQGWAKKRPLSWVVHEEQYGNRALPGEEPSSLLADTLRGIRPLDAKALGEAWDRLKRMTKPAGSLGMLEIIAAQLSGLSRKCPPPIPEPGCVAIFAGDHGVHAQGVTPWPQEVTAQMVANFLAGGAVVNAFAAQVGAEVCVVDVGVAAELPEPIQQGRTTGLLPRKVKPGTDDMTQGPAMSRDEALKAIEVGIETARDLVAAGNKVLITGDMGIANTTASSALIAVFAGVDPAEVTGRGTGIDDETHARKIEVIRRALTLHQPDPSDPIGVLAAVGGLEHAAIAGFLLGAASLRTPVILDGVIAGSAALVAKAIAPEVLAACIAGHRSAEPGHQAALAKLGLRPLIELDLRLGEGTGALLALPLVQSAARAMHDVATFDSAGVTEKN
ncbi:nicotinate-nucleotide--dimethylbenzimidazole phosphoribosyltransferase [Kitasatospora gansuensis]|uniref:Nicotinate-nucleotide--dimethylbenzimidazole phosphoribosyltransferase n=1 Tax=Kitasatospora gansuensis TaxID=258050 RepID=A0A7W7WGE8_9ACTN|nr:nicotinate-nucleotide--dimethylbenzimidazole phosphoribosyltransferase [Kitasatospora gansuensis]MBB4945374.1 nicotinate-nucleotide--dimethylbenzimidazole phosphoribosyltransferase [Kitasatospora gansuensis]